MNRKLYILRLFFFTLCVVLISTSSFSQQGVKKGSLRIKFSETQAAKLNKMQLSKSADGIVRTGFTAVDVLNEKHKATTLKRVFPDAGKFEKKHRKYGLHLWYEVVVDEKTNIHKASDDYKNLAEISTAEPIYEKTRGLATRNALKDVVQSSLTEEPNDPRYNEQWHYHNTGQTGGTADADIDLPEAWSIQTGNTNVIVSVHDGGIDINHEDLAGNMWINPGEIPGNNIDDDNNGYIDDVYGYNFADNNSSIPADDHGSHVGGTVAAETNNGIGMAGVAGGTGNDDGVRLMSCAVFTYSSGGFAESYIYAADNGAVISQNSWGYTNTGVFEDAVRDAIDYFIAEAGYDENGVQVGPMAGGLVIFAAGNDGQDGEWYPGYYEPVMAVAGTDHNDDKYYSSNFGSWVELAAPAVAVRSTTPGNSYSSFSGTSMACPHVSGVAALIVSQFINDNITPGQVWNRLTSSTDPLTFAGAENWGTGRLNALQALAVNDGLPPTTVTDLRTAYTDATTALFALTAPADQPDGYPANLYELRGSTEELTDANFELATLYNVSSPGTPGQSDSLLVKGLIPGTTYYFAIKSEDFFGNQSDISNIVTFATETAPEIAISGNPGVDIDVTVNPVGTGSFTIGNNGPASLDYSITAAYRGRVSTTSTLLYPGNNVSIVSEDNSNGTAILYNDLVTQNYSNTTQSFDNIYANVISYDDGDEEADGTIAVTAGGTPVNWATATAFEVPDMGGELFSLTHISGYILAEGAAATAPTQLSIIAGGNTPQNGELLLSQEFDNVIGGQYVTVSLEMPLQFNSNDKFWVVYNFPNVPLSMGHDDVPGGNRPGANLAYLNDEWLDIQDQPGWSNYVWNVRAIESVVDGLTLSSTEGTISTGQSESINVTYDASGATRNGSYIFDLFVLSNDPVNPVEKITSSVGVTGLPEPSIAIEPDTVNSTIDVGTNPVKTETITIFNNGGGELMFDFTQPVFDQTIHIPAITNSFPRSNELPSKGKAPMVKPKEANTPPVIQLAGSVGYGHDMYPGADFISLSTDEPGTYLSALPVSYTTFAGEFAKGDDAHMYIIEDDLQELWKLNIETGATEVIGSTMAFTDLATDKNSGVVYAAYYADPASQLYSIDLTTGASTLIGTMGDGIMISIACDGNGDLWGFNLDDNLYSINTETGAMTLVGSVGFDANYAQSMAWDPATDMIYMAAYNSTSSSGELRIVDTETGATQLIGAFPGGAEICSFGFPGGGGASDFMTVSPLSGTVAPNSSTTINVELDATTLPNGDYNSSLTLYSNDLNNLSTTIPVNLTVTGQVGVINTTTNFMEFGAVFAHGEKELPLIIYNTGIGELTISGITSNVPLFSTDFVEPVTLEMNDSLLVTVNFSSTFQGQFNGILVINSDDQANPAVEITVTATAISPPVISLSPENTQVALDAGQTTTERLVLRNYGMYPLQYSLPSVAVNRLLANPDVEKNNTDFIEGLTLQNSKEEPDTRNGHPVILGAGGPDEGGYLWIDSKETGGPVYSWIDISTTGTEIIADSDDGSVTLDLPFGFEFYGEIQNSVLVSSNGYLTFGTDGSDYTNDQIPNTNDPNNFIAPFWDDLRPSSKRGQVFYESSSDKFVVQYHEVGNYPSSSTGTATFQVALYPDGSIEYIYNDFTLENSASATIGIENATGDVGLQVAFNTDYITPGMSVLIFKGRTPFDLDASPVSGIVQPNGEQVIDLFIDATELNDGKYINELVIASNDPVRPVKVFTTELDVTGYPEIVVTPANIDFGSVFQGFTALSGITIENTGSNVLNVSSITSDDLSFVADLTNPLIIAPDQSVDVAITYTAVNLGLTQGTLTVASDDAFGNELALVALSGTGIVPPEMGVTTNPAPAAFVLNHGDTDTLVVNVANTGGSQLDYVVVKPFYTQKGNVAVSAETAPELSSKEATDDRVGSPVLQGAGGPDLFGYTWTDNNESVEVVYDWIEISQIGTNLNLGADEGVLVDIPFNFPFYYEGHNQITVASNGFLTFGDELGSYGGFSNQDIPDTKVPNNLIAPLWDDIEPQNNGGVYVYSTPDYFVVQYNEVPKFLGTGLATFQAILYPSGDIKFQYKDVNTFSGLTSSTVGVENEDGTDALNIVFNNYYVKDGLAVLISSPFIRGSVAEGMTARVELPINTESIYDGVYESPLRVISNDPSNLSVEIPTTLTVIGTPEISLSVDTTFFNDIYYLENGGFSDAQELTISNTGSKTLVIDSVYFHPESDVFISFDSLLIGTELAPKKSVTTSLVFIPNAVGHFSTHFKIESNDPVDSLVWTTLVANAIAPPVLSVSPSDTLQLVLTSDEIHTTTSTVTNLGGSLLDYTVEVVLHDQLGQDIPVERIYEPLTSVINVTRSTTPEVLSENFVQAYDILFTDSIVYDPPVAPDDYYGYGASAPYSSANRFVVESGSFTLTHIANYYQTEGVSIPVVMEIWEGGTLPATGTLVATQSFTHAEASAGANCLIELDSPLEFSQGDVFFVVMHYPQDMAFPAAFNNGVDGVDGVSYWYDVSGAMWLPEDPGYVYKIKAFQGETDSIDKPWLSISPELAVIEAGESQDHGLVANASLAEGGYNYATVRYTSNDPANPVFEWPVEVYVNQLPEIIEAPLGSQSMWETQELALIVYAMDPEGGELDYDLVSDNPFTTLIQNGDSVIIVHTPGFEDAGNYNIVVNITDDMDETVSVSWNLTVNNVNRYPELITDIPSKLYFPTDGMDEVNLAEYFSDPDGDALFYALNNSNNDAYALELVGETLYITPLEIGVGTVTVLAIDPYGSHYAATFNVRVRHTENHAPELTEALDNVMIYPNDPDVVIDLNDHFTDPDWDELSYSFFMAGTASVNVSLSEGILSLNPWQTGMAVLTIYANDNRGGVTATTLAVMVIGDDNALPFLSSSLSNKVYSTSASQDEIDLNSYFNDPDGDQLNYVAQIESGDAVEVSVENNVLIITPLKVGESTIVIYASDDKSGVASTRFTASVKSTSGVDDYEITRNSLINYPNPVKHLTTIEYEIVKAAHVQLEVINMNGSSLGMLVNEKQADGKHLVEFSVDELNSGVYFYRLILDGMQVKINSMTIE